MNIISKKLELNNSKFALSGFAIIIAVSLIYNITVDLCAILVLFLASYVVGTAVLDKFKFQVDISVKTAAGLGLIGVLIYYILLFGFGSNSVYLIIFIAIGVLGRGILKSGIEKIRETVNSSDFNYFLLTILLICFLMYVTYGAAPMSKFDTLAKHLPITLYAAENGKWYTNIMESVVYGEPMVLQYTFSAIFVKFGAYKALCLFNVALYFSIFHMLLKLCKSIYSGMNTYLFMAIYFTTPIFFEFSTVFYLDILPMFFISAALLCFGELDYKKTWMNLPIIAFLFGCAVFAKLTIVPTILIVGPVVFILALSYICHCKAYLKSALKLISCGLIFVSSFCASVLNIWYMTGNPLFPFFNQYFKSPYYPASNSADPFLNPIGLNLKSLISMVFYTSNNIEMANGGLGIYLLLVILIPIAMLIYRDKLFVIWTVLSFAIFQVNCIFTYNLRYNLTALLLIGMVISISASIILSKILNVKIRHIAIIILCLAIVIPDLQYIQTWYKFSDKISKINPDMVHYENTSIINEIPKNKRIISFNDPLKGDYDGFFLPLNLYNQTLIDQINDKKIPITEVINAFDYAIYRKGQSVSVPELETLMRQADDSNSIITQIMETDTHVLYKINKKPFTLKYEQSYDKPIATRIDAPVIYEFDAKDDYYQIEQTIECNSDMQMRFQINWLDKNGKFMNTDIFVYPLKKGITTSTSAPIKCLEGSKTGILYITPHDNNEAYILDYKLFSQSNGEYFKNLIKDYYDRKLLKNKSWIN